MIYPRRGKIPFVATMLSGLLGLCVSEVSAATDTYVSANKPNILLLVAEDLSPRIGSFGDPLAQTPNIDRLAAQGTRYTHVFTTAGVCAPSRAALITGQYQISFGGQHMRTSTGPLGEYYAQPEPHVRAFPEILRAHGYFTFTDRKLDYQFSGIGAGSGPFTIWDIDGTTDTAWRQRKSGQPFFGLINFLETHESGVMRATGTAHSKVHERTQKGRQAAGLVAPQTTSPEAVTLPPYYPDLPSVRADLARHYDNIKMMDARVGRILKALAEDDLLDNTVVIWTTDHGDGLPRAKRELYDSGLHVPLVLRLTKAMQTDLPKEDHRLVSFIDLAPTLLELANIPKPDYQHGTSIFTSARQYVYAARDRIDEVYDRQRAIRDDRFKYIRSWYPDVPGGHALAYRDNLDMVRSWREAYAEGALPPQQRRWFEPAGTDQLYDTQTDPHELNNLAQDPNHRGTLNSMRSALDVYLQKIGDTSIEDEVTMRAAMLDDGRVPETPPPTATHDDDLLTLSSPIGASIGYRLLDESHWQLYTTPIERLPVAIKSVRYGWRESVEKVIR